MPNKQIDDAPVPDDDESRDDFMDRCIDEVMDDNDVDEDTATEACTMAWEDRSVDRVMHKTHAADVSGMEFVLSDESPDRMDDVISADGWELANFKKNPIALFGHRSDFPIGKWRDLKVDKGELRGHLQLAPEGTSPRIDEIRRLIDAGILKAVSVGFRPLAHETRKNDDGDFIGFHFTKQELVECSLVSVPANPNALSVAKSLKVSSATLDLVFAGHGTKDLVTQRRGSNGGQARSKPQTRKGPPMSLSKRIQEVQAANVALRDQLTEHLKTLDNENVSDVQLEVTTELNSKIAQSDKLLASLKDAEKSLGMSAETETQTLPMVRTSSTETVPATPRQPFSLAKKFDPMDLIVRSLVVQAFAHTQKLTIEQARAYCAKEFARYDDDVTKVYIGFTVNKAATAPALTTVTGWAAELVQTVYAAFMETLMPQSVFPGLSAKGLSLSFGRAGKISIPTRSRTPTVAGSFVGEGNPIPVRQAAFTAQVLTPKKMGVITAWTREIDIASIPAIEGLLRQAIQEDTAVSLDSVLIDTNAATAVRPAGLLNGVTGQTPTAGGGFNAIIGDIKNLTGAILTASVGHVRTPVWLMNPQQRLSLTLTAAPGFAVFPFADEVAAGNLRGYPIISSGTIPLGTVILLDAADFVSVGENPEFDVSDQATLHFDDTTPLDIGTSGTPPVVAAPVKSLWQTNSLGLRLILPVNWLMRRTGMVSFVAGVTW